jgi:serine/threonine protein kinase
MKGIAFGLNYLHKFGVMHRDIKMENIMFRSQDSLEVVIVDFGLAAISEDEPYLFYRCGTPGYIAPEIVTMEGKQKINVGCDIFSAGVILHILLTKKYLFAG